MQDKRVLVIAGPSGVGESTITKEIIKKFPVFKRLVTATTRAPRLNEENTVDYYYFSVEEFKNKIAKGDIPEYQNTRNGVYYGTYKPDLETKLNKGLNVIANTDVVGARYFKQNYNATTIFIMPESLESLKKRHLDRDPDLSPEELQSRLNYAKYEIDDESPYYDYMVTNHYGKLDEAVNEVIALINSEGYKQKEIQ